MESSESPETYLGPLAEEFIKGCSLNEKRQIWQKLFSIFLSPEIDGEFKFPAPFPYRPGVIQFQDDEYLIFYTLKPDRSVTFHNIFRIKDLSMPPE